MKVLEEIRRNVYEIAEKKYCEAYLEIWNYVESLKADTYIIGDKIWIKLNGMFYSIPFPLKLKKIVKVRKHE